MVTNEDFREFARNVSYVTDSEKYGWSFVFLDLLSEQQKQEIQQVREFVSHTHTTSLCPLTVRRTFVNVVLPPRRHKPSHPIVEYM